jgi:hypothetical protein
MNSDSIIFKNETIIYHKRRFKKNKKQNFFVVFVCVLVTCLLFSIPCTTSAATKVAINTTSSNLVKGETLSLKVTGASKIAWSSTNKKVVTVSSSGKVTAVGYGTAYVKATVNSKTYKCWVRVVDPSKIYLDPTSTKVTVGGTAMSLNPTSGTYSAAAIKAMKITYKVSGNTGVKVSSTGKVTATKAGSFKVTAYVHGKKIETVAMKAVSAFPGFSVSEVKIEVEKFKEVYFANKFLANIDDIEVSSSNTNVVKVEPAFTVKDLDHYYGVEIEGVADGTATISVTVSGVTKTIKVIVGQGVTILTPLEAVKQNNFTGYSGNVLTTLQWIKNFIDTNNLNSNSLTDREKVTIIQNYFISNLSRNTGNTNYEGDISHLLFDGEGDCVAYATTFAFLCECIDLPCYFSSGSANPGDGRWYGHTWNKVKADGKWYYIDTGWTAVYKVLDKYFLSETLWSDHELEGEGYYANYTQETYLPYLFR